MVAPAVLRAWSVLALATTALAACSFAARYDNTHYQCGADGSCPDGYTCHVGVCLSLEPDRGGADAAEAADASGPADASPPGSPDAGPPGPPDASVPAPPDAPTSTVRFSDDFSDGVLTGWQPWTHPGCSVSETGGALQLDYNAGSQAYCGVDTAVAYDLRSGAVAVQVLQAPIIDGFETYVVLFSGDGTQQIQMIRDLGGLTMQLKINGSVSAAKTVANDGAAFWRIRGQAGTTYWETSSDGASWTVKHSTTATIDASAMLVELAAGTFPPAPSSATRTRFDQLRIF